MITVYANSTVTEYANELVKTLSNAHASGLWEMVGKVCGGIVEEMFARRGGKYGRPTWPGVSPEFYGHPRIGTDGNQYGVYTPRSNPLEASGDYKRSFCVLRSSPRSMEYGSAFVRRDKGRQYLANLMPYAGWGQYVYGKKRVNTFFKYVPRYALPDPHAEQFIQKFLPVHNRYLKKAIEDAHARTWLRSIVCTTKPGAAERRDAKNRKAWVEIFKTGEKL